MGCLTASHSPYRIRVRFQATGDETMTYEITIPSNDTYVQSPSSVFGSRDEEFQSAICAVAQLLGNCLRNPPGTGEIDPNAVGYELSYEPYEVDTNITSIYDTPPEHAKIIVTPKPGIDACISYDELTGMLKHVLAVPATGCPELSQIFDFCRITVSGPDAAGEWK